MDKVWHETRTRTAGRGQRLAEQEQTTTESRSDRIGRRLDQSETDRTNEAIYTNETPASVEKLKLKGITTNVQINWYHNLKRQAVFISRKSVTEGNMCLLATAVKKIAEKK